MKTYGHCSSMILIAALFAVLGMYGTTSAQDDDDIQSWNELQLTVTMTKQLDFFIQTTARIGENLNRVNEGRIGLGYVWKPTKSFSVSPYYIYIRARNADARFRTEHRLHLSGTYKFPAKGFGLSHRSLYEYRLRSSGNSWRYRPSLKFEKDFPKSFLKDTKYWITEEPFYISTTNKFSRNRFSIGITKALNKNLSLDLYYLRQNDGFSHPGDLNVIGTTWKVKL